jgi:CheY-like chemotaxis protein
MLHTETLSEGRARAESAWPVLDVPARSRKGECPLPGLDRPEAAHPRTLEDEGDVSWPAPAVPGKGPAAAGGDDDPAGPPRSASQRRGRIPASGETPSRPAVLFIDDQVGPDNELVWLLELEGFAVECAPSGAEGLARALARPWDAILLDLHLPDIPGLSVLERLMETGPATPVIALTGWYLSEEYERAALRLGAAAFRFKPLDALDLADLLRGVVARAAPTEVPSSAEPVRVEGAPGDVPSREAGREVPESVPGFPPADVPALHERLCGGDGMAVAPLAAALLPELERRLRRRFPHGDGHLLAEAAEDAFLDYVRRPARFDPGRGVALEEYLFEVACRDVVDRQRSEGRRRVGETEYARVVFDQPIRAGVEHFEIRHDLEVLLSTLADEGVVAGQTERRALRLLMEGERSPEVWARVLGVAGRPAEEQRREVKRLKDRLLRRLRRWWPGRR